MDGNRKRKTQKTAESLASKENCEFGFYFLSCQKRCAKSGKFMPEKLPILDVLEGNNSSIRIIPKKK